MSHHIGILAHHEPSGSRPTSFISRDQADELVRQLVAERISRRVIRMFSPSSVFMTMKHAPVAIAAAAGEMPKNLHLNYLASAEIPGLRFQPPEKDRYTMPLRAASVRRVWEQWRDELAG